MAAFFLLVRYLLRFREVLHFFSVSMQFKEEETFFGARRLSLAFLHLAIIFLVAFSLAGQILFIIQGNVAFFFNVTMIRGLPSVHAGLDREQHDNEHAGC